METYTLVFETPEGLQRQFVEAEEGFDIKAATRHNLGVRKFLKVGASFVALENLAAVIPASADKGS